MSRSSPLLDRVMDSPVTWLITALNLGIFMIAWQKGEHEGLRLLPETLLDYGAVFRISVWRGDYWRLLSAVFLHVGWIHLVWNTWALFGWCASVEKTLGSGWFAFAYLSTGIAASAISVLGHYAVSAGASGAGFGMVAVTLSLLYRRAGSWDAFISSAHVQSILKMTGLWLLIGFTTVSMDNYAHLGGFVFGVPCGLIAEARHGRARTGWWIAVAAYVAVLAGVVAAACTPGVGLGR